MIGKESMTMSRAINSIRPPRSDKDLARMVVSVAKATQVDSIVCITETGLLAQHLHRLSGRFRVIATTTNSETFDTLTMDSKDHPSDKY